MAWTRERQSKPNIQPMLDRIFSASQLSRQEYFQLTTAMLCDYNVTDEQRRQINRIFDDLQLSRLKIVD